MKSDPLDELLRSYARRPVPLFSEPLSSDVWQVIHRRRLRPFWSRLLPILDWREVSAEPHLVAAAIAVALAAGVLPAMLTARERIPRLARESLHFEVFSAAAPAILYQLPVPPAARLPLVQP
jgi:hypothetical protein